MNEKVEYALNRASFALKGVPEFAETKKHIDLALLKVAAVRLGVTVGE